MSYSFFNLMRFGISFPLLLTQLSSLSEGNLVSPETQVDYQPLQQLLAHQKWREANKKTGQLDLTG